MNKQWLLGSLLLAAGCVPAVEVEDEIRDHDVKIEEYMRASHAFVYTRDVQNTTGAAALVDLDTFDVKADGLGKGTWVGSNVGIASDGEFLYVIEKTSASITVIDPNAPARPVRQFTAEQGTNPEDLVRIGGKAYITRYDSAEVLVVNPDNGTKIGTVDLSEFNTAVDPYPEMSDAITAAGLVWVAVQRWDRQPWPNWWNASTDATTGLETGSYLVAIDPSDDMIAKRVKTLGTNPGNLRVDPRNGHLLVVSTAPDFTTGIESIDPATGESGGWVVEGAGYPNGIYFAAPTTDYIYVQTVDSFDWDRSWDGHVGTETAIIYAIDRATGKQRELVRNGEGYLSLGCMELSPLNLLVVCAGPGQRVTDTGLRVFDPASGKELTKSPIKTGLPPIGLAFFAQPATRTVEP